MKFCGSCGKQIPDESNACPYCGAFQDGFTPPAAEKKAFPVKKLLIALAALIVVLAVVLIAVKLLGGAGWEKPIDTLCDIANDKKVSESVIQDAARCFAGNVGKKDVDAAIDKACGLEADGEKLIDFLKDRVEDELEDLEDDYGKNVKFSYEIEDKEKLDEDDLEDYQDAYQQLGDLGVDVVKMASDHAEDIEDYTDGDVKEKDVEEIADHVKAFAKELKDVKITDGYEVDLTVKIEGKDDEDEADLTIAVLKMDGKWVISLNHRDLRAFAEELGNMSPIQIFDRLF